MTFGETSWLMLGAVLSGIATYAIPLGVSLFERQQRWTKRKRPARISWSKRERDCRRRGRSSHDSTRTALTRIELNRSSARIIANTDRILCRQGRLPCEDDLTTREDDCGATKPITRAIDSVNVLAVVGTNDGVERDIDGHPRRGASRCRW